MKIFCLLLIINIILIISFTLGKYEKITTLDKSIAFDCHSFFIGEEMKFKFKTDNECEDLLLYGYHDNYNKLYQFYNNQTPFSIPSTNKEIKTENNINYDIKYFTIKKKPTELNGFYGNYLLIKYNCSGSVEIENINPNLSGWAIFGIVIGCIIFIVAVIIIIIYFCKRKKIVISNGNRKPNENENSNGNNSTNDNENLNKKRNKKGNLILKNNINKNDEENEKSDKRMSVSIKIEQNNKQEDKNFKFRSYNNNIK